LTKYTELNRVEVRVLPPKVVKLLSQFAYYLKKHNGKVIKLSSKTVLQDVHDEYHAANSEVLDDIYNEIVAEVNSYAPSKPKKTKLKHNKPFRVLRSN